MSDGPMPFSYPVVEAALVSFTQVPLGHRPALLGRFRYFQKLDFPTPRVGRGKKVEYAFDELWQFALAFELLQVGVLPLRAVRLIRTSWPVIRQAIVDTWLDSSDVSRPIITLFPRALDDLNAGPGLEGVPVSDPFGTISVEELTHELISGASDSAGRWVLLDPLKIGWRLIDALDGASAPPGTTERSLRLWAGEGRKAKAIAKS